MRKEEFIASIEANLEEVLNDYFYKNYKNQILARRLSVEFTKTYNEEFLWNRALFLSTSSCILLSENANRRLASRGLKESAEIYEYLGLISEEYDRDFSKILSSLSYDLAGYQANAQCLIRDILNYSLTSKEQHNLLQEDNYILSHITLILNKNIAKAKTLINRSESNKVGIKYFDEAISKWYNNILYFDENDFLSSINKSYQFFLDTRNIHISHLLFLLKARLEIYLERSIWENLRQDEGIRNSLIWKKYVKLLTHDLYTSSGIKEIDKRTSKFEFWISQLRAVQQQVLSDDNFVIQMPTSAGKTFIAEITILNSLIKHPDKKCIYIAPFRALTNEKEIELSNYLSKLGYSISSLSGSYEIDEFQQIILEDTDVLIATPEKIDLLFRLNPDYFDNVSLLVIDEGHIVGEISTRASLVEFLLIKIRIKVPEIKTLFISAVMPPTNADEYSLWLSNKKENVIRSLNDYDTPQDEQWEPTRKLIGSFTWEGDNGRITFADIETEDERTRVKRGAFVPAIIKKKQYASSFPNGTNKAQTSASLALELSKDGLCLVFCAQVANTKQVGEAFISILDKLEESGQQVPTSFVKNKERESYFFAAKWFPEDSYIPKCLERGIGIHFGDLPEQVRQSVETDYNSGNLKVLISTNTIGQGLNFPIKHLIIHSTLISHKIPLKVRDFWNIVGRAGRACKETEGQIIFVINSPTDRRAYNKYINKRNLEEAHSIFYKVLDERSKRLIDFDTLLHNIQILSEPYLLNLLIEESVETETELLVERIIDNSLFKIQAAERGTNIEPLQRSFRETITKIRDEVPAELLPVFGETGFSVESNKAIAGYIDANIEELKTKVQADDYLGLLESITKLFSEGKIYEVYIDKLKKAGLDAFKVIDTLKSWINGNDIKTVQEEWQKISDDQLLLNILLSQGFYYRYTWGITSFNTILTFKLGVSRDELPEGINNLQTFVKYGLNNSTACLARSLGIKNRDIALLLAEKSDGLSGRAFIKWLSNLTTEDVLSFQINQYDSKNVLYTAMTLSSNRGGNIPETFDFEIRGTAYEVDRRVSSLSVKVGENLTYSRDHSNSYDTYAITILKDNIQIGFVPREFSKLIAVEIDINEEEYNLLVTSVTSKTTYNSISVRMSKI
ncbi:DEAD/DEAH box helicase [Pontibacter sp. BAB1700]|uniref:DEAD/DEAH box helicase n=1 Tax=Pontibacter sp. BAB1700 TaxID=1144253 RepID=UPI00026BD1B9|nr:DEAD/DEAH box helicase [Pontibacter sp. BAB1700]EJF10971.1 DEAD/DEAH box helicase-like protein [Pontibacter sp. BAB1700]